DRCEGGWRRERKTTTPGVRLIGAAVNPGKSRRSVRGMRGGVDDLGHAVMIEVDRHESRTDKNGHAFPDYCCFWIIYLDADTSFEFDRERLEGPAAYHRQQPFLKTLSCHWFPF